ncbi:hypothetical protein JCM10908_006102 [Rhodotorula pacifica]|uniref:uncharacterized protein n=1 Tax=Rhodotorula pacifica TaxID=1495444 RepID=UPI00316D4C5E
MARSPEPQLVTVSEQERAKQRRADTDNSGGESDGDDSEDEEVFEVEAIHASRWDDDAGAMRYLIKWKGYADAEKTWEPEENLNCDDVLRAYKKTKAAREAKAAGKKSKSAGRSPAKTKARPAAETDDDDEDDGGVSMKELDARRAQAKEKAKTKRRASAPARSEDAVARKWEQKANKDAKKPRASTSAIPPPAKRKASSPPPPSSTSKEPNKHPKVVATEKDRRPAKRLSQIVDSESEADDAGSAATTPAVAALQATVSAPPASAPAVPAATSIAPPNGDDGPAALVIRGAAQTAATTLASAAQQPPPNVTSINPAATLLNGSAGSTSQYMSTDAPSAETAVKQPAVKRPPVPQGPWANSQLGSLLSKSYKVKPALLPPPVSLPIDDASGARVRFAANPILPNGTGRPAGRSMSPPVRAPSALKYASAQGSERRSASPALITQPSAAAVLATHATPNEPAQNDSTMSSTPNETGPSEGKVAPSSQAPEAPSGSVGTTSSAAEQSEEEQKQTRLRSIENRLKGSSWYQVNAMFQEENLLVACAEAVPMDPQLALRLRNKSIAILYPPEVNEQVTGEGLALSYLLLATGSKTPTYLSDLEALFLHRTEPPEKLEAFYAELVNLDRPVEFFSFGSGKPIASILGSGYLVLPSLSALRLGAAFERYCASTARVFGRTCLTTVHPASIARARSLPNWYRIVESIVSQSVSMIDKTELRMESRFVTTESSTLLAPGLVPPAPLPQISADEEVDELLEHLRFARAKSLSMWRRFVIVVNESTPDLEARARRIGVEVHTWTSLGAYVAANPFG